MQLELTIANTAVTQQAVLDNRIDVGLIEGFVASELLAFETLAADEMIAIAAPTHAALRESPLPLRALGHFPILMRELGSGSRDVVEAALRERGVVLTPTMSLGSTEAIKNAVRHGLGIAIVSRLSVEEELQSRRLAELPLRDLQIRRDLYLVSLKGKRHSPATAAFIALAQRRQLTPRSAPPGDSYAI